jgi:protein-disulfide isomerase
MEEKKYSSDEEVNLNVGEIDVAISPKKVKRDMFLPVSILIAALMVGGAIVFATLYKGGTTAPAGATAPAGNGNVIAATSTAANTAAAAMTLGPRDAILGNASATVTLIEYGDYQCPFCTQFFSQTEPQIIQNYINTGKVRMVFRDFAFLGAESTAAADAAQCAEDQNKLWAYHDALYAAKVGDENSGGSENDGFYTTAEFLKLAQQVGLNIPTFTSCINNNTDANIVAQEKSDAANVGINSTPSFIVNGTIIAGAQPYSVFQQALDAALAQAGTQK